MMKRIIFLIDGFNLYHAIKGMKKNEYKWLNLDKLAKCFTKKDEKICAVYYFTALANWNQEKVSKHKIYIKALETVNVQTIYGRFKKRSKKCPKCNQIYWTHEEKETDVNIAIYLFRLSIENKFDTAFIVSGDSDLSPSIKAVKDLYPEKNIVIIVPPGRKSLDLENSCDLSMKIKEKHLKSSVFPEKITLPDNSIITRPPSWV